MVFVYAPVFAWCMMCCVYDDLLAFDDVFFLFSFDVLFVFLVMCTWFSCAYI